MTEVPSSDPRFLPGFKTGAIPGTAVYMGEGREFDTKIEIFDWSGPNLTHEDAADVEAAATLAKTDTTSWVNVIGIHDAGFIEALAEKFELHPLSVEDILNPHQQTKVETYDDYDLIVLKMAYAAADGTTHQEQISIVLGGSFVLTFQERPEDVFDGVRQRLRAHAGRLRNRGHDYLAYALMDAVVDSYVMLIEDLGSRVEREEDVLDGGDPSLIRNVPARLHTLKRELMALRKAVLPLRDAVYSLGRDAGDRVQPTTLPFLRDLHDHLAQLVDSVDIYRELISGLLGLHLALVGQKTNEEMRILTVIGTIFIPLTFIAGLYGMNFEYMPELKFRWGYPALLIAMAGVAGALIVQFRRRRWL